MKSYVVMISWMELTPSRRKYSTKSKTFRDVMANDICEARDKCLQQLAGKISPAVNCIWPTI